MPFKLESFSAPRTRVVHVHHHHYSDSVPDSSEDGHDEDKYEEDNYEEDEYMENEYDEDEYVENEHEEDKYEEFKFSDNTSELEFSSNIKSNSPFTTSFDEDSSYSGYDESS